VVTDEEPLELRSEDETDAPAPVAPTPPSRFKAQDEFVLDARRLADDEPAAPSGLTRRPLAPAAAQPRLSAGEPAAARPPAGSGTLFERMASLTGRRKAGEEEEDEAEDAGAVNIPRFLGRQNNQ
jgi:cell division protein FtsZ